jgi:hypothetical protein
MNLLVNPKQRFAIPPPARSLLIALCPLLFAVSILAQPAQETSTANVLAPRIQFSEMEFDFGTVPSSDVLQHTFVVTNAGNAVLEISAVRAGCGCTTPGDWDRQIAPGKTGRIPIQFAPASFKGPIKKNIVVESNDPRQPVVALHIQANVLRLFDLQPKVAYFTMVEDEVSDAAKVVRILCNLEEGVLLEQPVSTNAAFKAELKTVHPGRQYELHVLCDNSFPGDSTQGTITIQTSVTNLPVLNVAAAARRQPAVSLMPPQVRLPAALNPDFRYAVNVRNAGGVPLKLSEPSINVKGLFAEITENEFANVSVIGLTAEPDFKLAPGQQAELTVKTSHPKYPVLRVPITQFPARTPPPAGPSE